MVWDFAEAMSIAGAAGRYRQDLPIHAESVSISRAVRARIRHPGHTLKAIIQVAKKVDRLTRRITTTSAMLIYPTSSMFGFAGLCDSIYPDLYRDTCSAEGGRICSNAISPWGKECAEAFFLDGMTRGDSQSGEQAHPAFPVTIYYAFKQADTDSEDATSSSGWVTFLDAVSSQVLR